MDTFWKCIIMSATMLALSIVPVMAQDTLSGIGDGGMLVSASYNALAEPVVVEDSRGGAYIIWMHASEPPANPLIGASLTPHVQHVSSAGSLLFAPEGAHVSDQATDTGQGRPAAVSLNKGVIVFWVDARDGSSSLYAQRLSGSGEQLWDPSGVRIADHAAGHMRPTAVPDGSGGAIVLWEDDRNDAFDLYAQRIDPSGKCMWEENGIPIAVAPLAQISAHMSPDKHGGAVIAWASNQDSGIGSHWDVYAQYVDHDGATTFGTTGIAVCAIPGMQSYPRIVPDQHGGAIVAWLDWRNVLPAVYANRIDERGRQRWAQNGVCVSTGSNSAATMDMVENTNNGVYVSWSNHFGPASDILLTSITDSGVAAWRAPVQLDHPLGNAFHANPTLVKSTGNWVYVVWSSQESTGNTLYAQRVDLRGNTLWQCGGNVVARGPFSHQVPGVTLTKNFDLVTTWSARYRDHAERDGIYAQMLDKDGVRQWEN